MTPMPSYPDITSQIRRLQRLSMAMSVLLLLACSSTGPKPDSASGDVQQANVQPQALEELIEITRAGMPRRFVASKSSDVRQILQNWAKTAGMKLQWKSVQSLSTTGAIDELSIHAAVMSLAQQFPSDQAALMVHFPNPKNMIVSDVLSKDQSTQNCPPVPAGAVLIGQYCILAEQVWYVDQTDKFLSETLQRWATTAKKDLSWQSGLDWPIKLSSRKSYSGELHEAMADLMEELSQQGVDLQFSITNKSLVIQTPTSSQAQKESKK